MTDQQLVAVLIPVGDAIHWAHQTFAVERNQRLSAASAQALANPGVTVEGEIVRFSAYRVPLATSTKTMDDVDAAVSEANLPEGPCLVTVTSIKGVSDE